jgi:hypothetical protein
MYRWLAKKLGLKSFLSSPVSFGFAHAAQCKECRRRTHQLTPPWPSYFFAMGHSQCTHTHSYEHTRVNPTPRSIFEAKIDKKSPQTSRYRRERRLPLKTQTSLNVEKFAPTGSQIQNLRCYRGFLSTSLHALSYFSYMFQACYIMLVNLSQGI